LNTKPLSRNPYPQTLNPKPSNQAAVDVASGVTKEGGVAKDPSKVHKPKP